MKEVMNKAQELAEAIADSEVYLRMKQLEGELRHDPEASALVADLYEKRRRVEDLLSSNQMDPEELKQASLEMNAAEEAMNAHPAVQTLKEARKDFQTMMDNVNQLLRLVITGEVREEDTAGRRSRGCSGSCEGCSGCS